MQVNNADHCHPLLRVTVDPSWEVSYLIYLEKGVDICVQAVYASLHQDLYPVLSQALDQEDYQGYPDYYNNDVAIHIEELHQKGVDSDPKVGEQGTSAEHTHKAIIVRHSLIVLEAQETAGQYVDSN